MNSNPDSTAERGEGADRELTYTDGETTFHGLLCPAGADDSPRPGLLLIHGGGGLDAHPRAQARRYRALGYTVLACDMFGEGVAGDRSRIVATLTALRDDPDLLVRRGRAALDALAQCPETDANTPAAAVGFCFGGLAALTLARAGLPLAAAVSMHGSLATKRPAEPGGVRARLLVCHGARDPHVPMSDVAAFAAEMIRAEADWRLIAYGRAMHGFTHTDAVPGAVAGVEYDREADEASFAAAREFLGLSVE
jgi:dienelactone hydrolase